MRALKMQWKLALMLVLATWLSGCGGSGGGSSAPPAPAITTQPQSATINVGGSAMFSVAASGSDLAYQWLRGGQAIAGATGSSYTLNPVSAGDDQAKFSVTVSNMGGQVTSSTALLTVVSPPTVTTQPQNTTVAPGRVASFSVAASALNGTLTYQWYKGSSALADGGNVSGSASGTLTLQQVTATDAGAYSVKVSDAAGSVSSDAATLTIAATRLVVTATGVGLSQVGTRSVLQRTIQVLGDSGRTDIPWTATSDSAWLSVTASGTTGGDLVITANPAGAPAGTTQFANVSVTSANPAVTNQVTVRVGLYVSSVAATTKVLPIPATHLATSPVEPLVAVAAAGTSVNLYNVYTGALVRTLSGVSAAAGPMTFSEDGRTLFVYDTTNLAVVEVDTPTGAVLHTYGASASVPFGTAGNAITVLHPNGYPMLATPVGLYYDLATGTQFQDPHPDSAFLSSAFSFAVSPDQSLLAAQDGSTVRLSRSDDGTQLTVQHNIMTLPVNTVENSTNGQSCFSASGDRLYTASGAPYDFPATSVASSQVIQVLPGSNYPDAIQCVWNGVVVGGIDGYYQTSDIFVYYGPTGVGLGQLNSSGPTTSDRDLLSRGLAVSADGTVLVSTWSTLPGTDTGAGVYLQALPAPPP